MRISSTGNQNMKTHHAVPYIIALASPSQRPNLIGDIMNVPACAKTMKNTNPHRVITDAEAKSSRVMNYLVIGVLSVASISALFTAVGLLKVLAMLVLFGCVIMILELVLTGGWNAKLGSNELAELAEIAQRTPEVAQWASAAVRDGHTLRASDLDAAKATHREYLQMAVRTKAIAALQSGRRE